MFLVQTTLEEQAHTQSYRHRGLVGVWSAAGIVSLPVRMFRPLLPLTASQLPAIYFPWRVLGQQRRAGSPLVGQSSRSNKWTPHLQRHELGEPCEHTWDCPLSRCHVWTCTFPANTAPQVVKETSPRAESFTPNTTAQSCHHPRV